MHSIPANLKQLIFEKNETEPLSSHEQALWDEWIAFSETPEPAHLDLQSPDVREALQFCSQMTEEKQARWKRFEQTVIMNDPGVIQFKHRQQKQLWTRVAVAASFLILVGAGIIWLSVRNVHTVPATPLPGTVSTTTTIEPGGKKAILTLSDNSTIVLDNAQNGTVARQGATNVIKQGEGIVTYNAISEASQKSGAPLTIDHSPLTYNTITTPKGGEYKVILPDGSGVWVNAGSTLRYPTAFTGNSRTVELKGEAYFEVARHSSKPFHIKTGESELIVKGTQFNVQAYTNNKVVTLAEGALQVRAGNRSETLSPNQQAIVSDKQISIKKNIDVSQALAWKNGYINLEGESIQSIMQQIGRWYDVEVVVDEHLQVTDLVGKIDKNKNFDSLLKLLEKLTDKKVVFHVENRKVTVTEDR